MILPDLVLPSRVNQRWHYSGIDSPEYCIDKEHFSDYPSEVIYEYNSRGFRDAEWPTDLGELRQAVWCVGDSFTVGVGQPFDHIWPQVLRTAANRNVINVSLDGASNNWIARRVNDMRRCIDPEQIVIMWSYLERRELDWSMVKQQSWERWYNDCKDPTWPTCPPWDRLHLLPPPIQQELKNLHNVPIDRDNAMFTYDWLDEHRRVQDAAASREENFENWCQCIDLVADAANIIHCMIPRFAPMDLAKNCVDYVINKKLTCLGECKQLDFARDGHHFDIITATWLADQVIDQWQR